MAMEPDGSAALDLSAILQISEQEASRLLKIHNNDTQAAVSAFFDGGARDAQPSGGWEEGPFSTYTDRSGNNAPSGPSFRIESDESLGVNVFNDNTSRPDTTPTRPPSPDSGGDQSEFKPIEEIPFTTGSTEDDDMSRAIKMSLQETSEQESGVTVAQVQSFGPATRNSYETNKWAVTRSAQTFTHEIILDPDPVDRQRAPHHPAFLKPSNNGPFISSLLTILQYIPLAREALLMRDYVMEDYGAHEKWWSGVPATVSRIVDLNTTQGTIDGDEVLFEIQRLMAFLTKTERAYGSVDVLTNLDTFGDNIPNTSLPRLLDRWTENASRIRPDQSIMQVFQSRASRGNDVEREEPLRFSVLDVIVENQIADHGLSLYDSLDFLIWPDDKESEMGNTYINEMAGLMTIKLERQDPSKTGAGLKIPAVWYADRYLEESKSYSLQMRAEKLKIRESLVRLQEVEDDLSSFALDAEGKSVDPRKLVQFTIDHLKRSATGATDEDEEDEQTDISADDDAEMSDASTDPTEPGDQRQEGFEAAAAELEKVLDTMNRQLQAIEDRREEARQTVREHSKLLTDGSGETEPTPQYPYTLRGVATGPSITYVLKPNEPGDEELTLDARNRGSQWWKIDFDATAHSPVHVTRVQELQVLKAAREEGHSVLLVYANEDAMKPVADDSLPISLENFVKSDNLQFQEELTEPQARFSMTPPSDTVAEQGDWDEDHRDEVMEDNWVCDPGFGDTVPEVGLANGLAVSEQEELPMQEMQEIPRATESLHSAKRKADERSVAGLEAGGLDGDNKTVRFAKDQSW
ncbi:MAG: hypothetical protein M1814_006198 [Vezdaea aestivalis]|nr:MAG: hypothetical protein M1814_006198 [Vezdaea aestivalis]